MMKDALLRAASRCATEVEPVLWLQQKASPCSGEWRKCRGSGSEVWGWQ